MLPPKTTEIPALYKRALSAQAAGRADEALSIHRAILKTRPNLPESHFQIGRIHAAAGRKTQAETAFRKALEAKPREAAIWQELGRVLSGGKLKKLTRDAAALGITINAEPDVKPIFEMIRKGKLETAEHEALALTRSAPGAFGPVLALATARERQGKWDEVAEPARKAVALDPSNAMAKSLLGQAYGRTGFAHLAEPILQEAVDLDPVHAPHLALLYEHSARFEQAAEVLQKALRVLPDRTAFRVSLAKYLVNLGRIDEARAAMGEAIETGQDAAEGLHLLGSELEGEGYRSEAETVLREAMGHDPRSLNIRLSLAGLYQSAGDLKRSREMLADLIREYPNSWEPFRTYVNTKKMTVLDSALDGLKKCLADPGLSPVGQRNLNFAMGKAAADLGHHDQVFTYLNRANGLSAKQFPYDFAKDLEKARHFVRLWRETGAATPASDLRDHVVFVTGTPRSGTTLVETIVAAHADVEAAGELPYLRQAFSPLMNELAAEGKVPAAAYRTAGEVYLRAARRRARTDGVFTDKAIGTRLTIGFAALALPNAKFLVLRRDPRDVGLSIYKNMFVEGTHGYSTNLFEIGRVMRLSQAMVEFWARELPDKVHVVDYAALTGEPEPNIRALVAAAGLDWDDACLEPHKVKRQVKTLSFAQVRQPIYKTSVAGWKRYEKELQPLFEGLQTEITLD